MACHNHIHDIRNYNGHLSQLNYWYNF